MSESCVSMAQYLVSSIYYLLSRWLDGRSCAHISAPGCLPPRSLAALRVWHDDRHQHRAGPRLLAQLRSWLLLHTGSLSGNINGILKKGRLTRTVGAVVIKWQKKLHSDSGAQNTNTFQSNLDTLTLPVILPRLDTTWCKCLCMQQWTSIWNFNI